VLAGLFERQALAPNPEQLAFLALTVVVTIGLTGGDFGRCLLAKFIMVLRPRVTSTRDGGLFNMALGHTVQVLNLGSSML
jgi:hypothetical protein